MRLDEQVAQELKRAVRGEVIGAGDDGYDAARRVWNLEIDKHPALIVRCSGAADGISAVNIAHSHDVPVAVRGGGHNIAGKSMSEGGLTIDLSRTKGIRVDPVHRTAHAQAGLTIAEFDHETQAFGLATTLGVISDTGIAGLTLGGGYGWLNGKYGLACDNLLSADVVTADGQLVKTSAQENADLFWGIRGGAGNFGIVTAFEYQLHPVGPVLGGMVVHSLASGEEVVRFYNEYASAAPDELTLLAALVSGPDGSPAIAIAVCYCGSLEAGEKVLQPLRTFGPPIADLIRPMAYLDVQKMLDDAFPQHHHYYWKSSLIRELSEGAIETLLAHMPKKPTLLSSAGIQQLHGAAGRVSATETAFAHRYDHYDWFPVSIWLDPADSSENIRWARELWEAMQPFVEQSVYVNDLGEEGDERVRAAYGPNYDRLVALKNKYDPTNFFRLNQNIAPAAASLPRE